MQRASDGVRGSASRALLARALLVRALPRWSVRGERAFLRHLAASLPADAEAPKHVVMLIDSDLGLVRAIASAYPQSSVHVFSVQPVQRRSVLIPPNVRITPAENMSAVHEAMKLLGTISLIVDGLEAGHPLQVPALRELIYHLRSAGTYCIRRMGADVRDVVRRLGALNEEFDLSVREQSSIRAVGAIAQKDPTGPVATRRVAAAAGQIVHVGRSVFIRKRFLHLLKMREEAVTPTFIEHRARTWLHERTLVSGRPFVSRATVRVNRPELARRFSPAFDLPSMKFRSYDFVTCTPRQILSRGNLLLPETFRLSRRRYLKHDFLLDVDARFAQVPGSLKDPPTLRGAYFYLDCEYPSVYGHLLTDMVGRLWGWELARAEDPSVRLLISSRRRDEGRLPGWMLELLTAYGIPESSVTVLDRTSVVERLYSVTPQFVNFAYVDPAVEQTWQRLLDRLVPTSMERTPTKLFVTRPRGTARTCRNADEVEALFAGYGFAVVRPELLPLAQQATLFRNAEVVAGFGGSAMLNTVFGQSPKRKLVLNPASHSAINEYLISSVLGDEIDYVYSDAELAGVPGASRRERYQSPYSVDLDRDGALLRDFARAS
ncbi:DUF563 domain-containing protein [uncultured Amnibacterium sp.]|uniref:glycosyltransferase family 61 protein n=1 Tax=uncultured Amnibacterium sp. TaxID=1631851 RepID=UPI0035CA680A